MDWTWQFDSLAADGITLATAAAAIVSLVLSAAVSVWLLSCGARRRFAALPRGLRWLGSPLGRAVAAAFVVLSFDGLYLSKGGYNALALVVGLGLQLLLAAVCVVVRRGAAARSHAAAALVWALAIGAMAGFSRFNVRLATERAEVVIAACRRFESDFDRLPTTLDELVPGYLPRVPLASWTVLGAFSYETRTKPQLTFFNPWPILRVYVFETGQWWWDDRPMPLLPPRHVGPSDARSTPASGAPSASRSANDCRARQILSPVRGYARAGRAAQVQSQCAASAATGPM